MESLACERELLYDWLFILQEITYLMSAAQNPLGLYIHMPWCIRKCPYCDFNSHAVRGEIPEAHYVTQLLRDLVNALFC